MKKIALVLGSIREWSWAEIIATSLQTLAPQGYEFVLVHVKDLPLYDSNGDANPPAAWTNFRSQLQETDGTIFITPEYNRSLSGALKNAIDVGSRPYGQSALSAKPTGVISYSPSPLGGFWANMAVRQTATVLDMYMMSFPEGFTPFVQNMFDENGVLNADGKDHFQKFVDGYISWFEKFN